MVLLNSKVYSPSSYVGSPRFTRMEKTVQTTTLDGEVYPTLEQVGLVPLSYFARKLNHPFLDGGVLDAGRPCSSREGLSGTCFTQEKG